ncbi:CaiB/BaiF CoA transferase family protein [Parvicella tangerina]|uniref:Acetyl-CoA:oxalate CoA-transferase n=1 Tax=Parvicella tangerina TaxID=2829795 RepID=A0A916JNS4_9FLAO|nr:CoA transferase [Parvicella tangerina]CAG5083489.1 Acetyl-CoA:oxalate CoA-transferase [Parvicella tangerina]
MEIFKDLKVVELASVLAGPSVGMFFAELGADVVKFENKLTGGDVTRNWRVANEPKKGQSAYFSSVNFNKKHFLVNFNDQNDLDKVLEAIYDADIVVCNFKEGYDKKFGLDYASLKASNPKLIYAQVGGYASLPDKVAFDVVLQAETGYMFMNGQKTSPPTKLPLAFMDILAAHQLKEGILVALLKRSVSGKGCHVNTTLEESAIASLVNQASNYLMADHIPTRIGSLHPNIAPYGELFETKDDALIVLAIGSDQQFKKLCNLLGSDLYQNEKFLSNQDRVLHRSELEQALIPLFKAINSDEFIRQCIGAQVPIGKVKNLAEVFASPFAKSMILEEEVNGQLTKRVKSVAFSIRD